MEAEASSFGGQCNRPVFDPARPLFASWQPRADNPQPTPKLPLASDPFRSLQDQFFDLTMVHAIYEREVKERLSDAQA